MWWSLRVTRRNNGVAVPLPTQIKTGQWVTAWPSQDICYFLFAFFFLGRGVGPIRRHQIFQWLTDSFTYRVPNEYSQCWPREPCAFPSRSHMPQLICVGFWESVAKREHLTLFGKDGEWNKVGWRTTFGGPCYSFWALYVNMILIRVMWVLLEPISLFFILSRLDLGHEPRAVTMKLWEPKGKCPKRRPKAPPKSSTLIYDI